MKGGVRFYLAGAVMLLALTGCTHGTSVAVPGLGYAEVTDSIDLPPRTSEIFAPSPPIRMGKKHVYLLLASSRRQRRDRLDRHHVHGSARLDEALRCAGRRHRL